MLLSLLISLLVVLLLYWAVVQVLNVFGIREPFYTLVRVVLVLVLVYLVLNTLGLVPRWL